MSKYYFDGKGKSVRPAIAILLARAFNAHVGEDNISEEVLAQQRKVAVVTEMIHTASLVRYTEVEKIACTWFGEICYCCS